MENSQLEKVTQQIQDIMTKNNLKFGVNAQIVLLPNDNTPSQTDRLESDQSFNIPVPESSVTDNASKLE